jgi:hypothetical protein
MPRKSSYSYAIGLSEAAFSVRSASAAEVSQFPVGSITSMSGESAGSVVAVPGVYVYNRLFYFHNVQ